MHISAHCGEQPLQELLQTATATAAGPLIAPCSAAAAAAAIGAASVLLVGVRVPGVALLWCTVARHRQHNQCTTSCSSALWGIMIMHAHITEQ